MQCPAQSSKKQMHVLIVDDSELARNYHAYIVREAGFRVTTAIDGVDGLERFYQGHFDAVITDVNMSAMDGCELVRRLRQDAQNDALPILVISSEDSAKERQACLRAGANLFLCKPSSPAQLIEALQMLLPARAEEPAP